VNPDDFELPYVSRETQEKLELYVRLLTKWQSTINLVSRGTLSDVWRRHILDSLQIVPFIEGTKILDVGSGGGFPGMVLAIYGKFFVTCLDSDRRKMLFLSEVARATDTEVTIITDRIENLADPEFNTVCARGFSELVNLLNITKKFAPLGRGVFLKGATLNQELQRARWRYDFEDEIHPSRTNDDGRIVIVHSIADRIR
jgi:16S rRNA (guanine527-N7)-methyltransferase